MSKLIRLGTLCVFGALGVGLAIGLARVWAPPAQFGDVKAPRAAASATPPATSPATPSAASESLVVAPAPARETSRTIEQPRTAKPTSAKPTSAQSSAAQPTTATSIKQPAELLAAGEEPVGAAPFPIPRQLANPQRYTVQVNFPDELSATAKPDPAEAIQSALELGSKMAEGFVNRLDGWSHKSSSDVAQPPGEGAANKPAQVSETGPSQADTLPEPPAPEPIRMRRSPEHSELILPKPNPVGEGDQHLEIYVDGRDIREVLAMLGEQAGWNILPSKSVTGPITVSLTDVDAETALGAIVRSAGFVARREGNLVYVGAPQDFTQYEQGLEHIGTRVFRPNYVTAAELQALITPILTPNIGKISVSSPAMTGIQSDDTQAGGDALAGGDAVLVQDFESVLAQIEQVVQEVDTLPAQVHIEAMIISVQLNDTCNGGVNFELLQNSGNLRLGLGAPTSSLANLNVDNNGLKLGILNGNVSTFVDALETVGDTNVIATPRLMVLNKQRAEILIGAQLGYVNTTVTPTSSTQSVQFLEVGTQLRIRPFISSDDRIRLEIHPELSTGRVKTEGGFTLPEKEVTKVTTNVMASNGCTVIIGGLLREDLENSKSQIPVLGNLPLLGVLFRHKLERTKREEIFVLLTPRIVCEPLVCQTGAAARADFLDRREAFRDVRSPISRRALARKEAEMAHDAWIIGDTDKARRHLQRAIYMDPQSRGINELRRLILGEAATFSAAPALGEPTPAAMPRPIGVDGEELPEWIVDELVAPRDGALQGLAPQPRNPGAPGRNQPIVRPERKP